MAGKVKTKFPQFINAKDYSFPEKLVLDLHDLATIVLRERLFSQTQFRYSQLYEICNDSEKATCLPSDAQATWTSLPDPKVGYFLREPSEVAEDAPATEPYDFLHENFKGKDIPDEQSLETIFWRVKHHDSGFVLAHALQLVLDALPESTKLRICTSQGHRIECKARSSAVAEMNILPKMTSYICNIRARPDLGPNKVDIDQHYTGGELNGIPWLYLIFGEKEDATGDVLTDRRVAVDLVAPMLGLRGLGNEVFAMEQIGVYHHKLLSKVAGESEEYVLSGRILMADEDKARASADIATRVLARLQKITRGEEVYCAYCGRDEAESMCENCHGKARYCSPECQKKGWRYHKVWCKGDAGTKT
ncbi:uncharacterized protein FOMMEDRAFT_162230 [Fomitiporia mediterranea MF3/22]|uniref:uncharacterized protein n=1 Tax=Fomitiporia mediterranea (strain MF3/22) TaxID=694068 RepID=UPI00044076D5|nr:uncharacterized protein FOMMEDRAFT_162230 [Fomitiporia mediterranea MF3/22]EJC97889.1 hypothetical protein FOMMEDRAFT_162230 [Fomitiporia mediterranea MF3/22]